MDIACLSPKCVRILTFISLSFQKGDHLKYLNINIYYQKQKNLNKKRIFINGKKFHSVNICFVIHAFTTTFIKNQLFKML